MRSLFKMTNAGYIAAIEFLRSKYSKVNDSTLTEYEWYKLAGPELGYNAVSWANFIILRKRAPW
jgi:hypothetical protein